MNNGSSGAQATTSSTPWGGVQPYMSDNFDQARNQYYSGGAQYFPGSTVAPFSPQTQNAFDMTTNLATNGGQYDGAINSNVTSGMNQSLPGMGGAISNANSIASGNGAGAGLVKNGADNQFNNIGTAQNFASNGQTPYLNNLNQFNGIIDTNAANMAINTAQQATQSGAGYGYLNDTASGQYLGANPYLDQMYDTAARGVTDNWTNSVLPGINSSFGMSGAGGSALSALALGDEAYKTQTTLADMAGSMYGNAYNSERGLMANAGSQLASIDQNAVGMGLDTYNNERSLGLNASSIGLDNARQTQALAGDLYGTAKSNQIDAGNILGNQQLGGIDALNTTYSNIDRSKATATQNAIAMDGNYANRIGQLGQVGAQIEDQSQRLIDDQKNRYDFYQNSPYQNLSNYSGVVNGMPGGFGTTTQTGAAPSRTANAVGAGMTGAGVGSTFGPWGAAIGGGVGALAGYYG